MSTFEYVVDAFDTQSWFLNGKLHREDGPAIIGADGFRAWWLKGERHREDGPAIIWADGSQSWYLNGKRYLDKKKFQEDAKISDEDMIALLLKYNWK